MSEFPMTLLGKKMLDQELEHLIRVDREELKIALAEARELGDLKENAEYHAAKEKQSHLEGRIMELQAKVARAQIIDPSKFNGDKIVFGATVTLFDVEKDCSVTYQIVGEDEAKSSPHKISFNSPLGRALIGKENGDEVIVKAPKGNVTYQVEDVQYI
jgi:transcription elongation factor GreA